MASRLSPEKNIGLALEVFKKIIIQHPKIGLCIVGSGPEERQLRKRAQALGIEKSVLFEGWQQDLGPYYAHAKLFLHTSLYEGYGLVLVEAGRVGLPIVTSDVGIAGDILINNKNAFVCPVNDKGCFFKHLLSIIENNDLRMEFSRRIVDDVSRGMIADKHAYLEAYQHLLTKAHSAQ